MATTPDYRILAAPRISAAKFASILRAGSSPAYPDAAACYNAAVARGVDPAVLLAVFRKESTYGRFGRARTNRSWGNLRRSPSYPTVDGFVRYPSWSAGAADAARLLAIYGANKIRPGKNTSTVQTMPYVWAPASDGNGPDRYGDQLARWIREWSGAAGDATPTGSGSGSSGSGSSVGSGTTTGSGGGEPLGAFYLDGKPLVTYPRGSSSWSANAILAILHPANYFGRVELSNVAGIAAAQEAARAVFKADEGKPWNEALHAEWARELGAAAIAAGDPLGGIADGIAAAIGDAPKAIGKAFEEVAKLAAILAIIALALYRLLRA